MDTVGYTVMVCLHSKQDSAQLLLTVLRSVKNQGSTLYFVVMCMCQVIVIV